MVRSHSQTYEMFNRGGAARKNLSAIVIGSPVGQVEGGFVNGE